MAVDGETEGVIVSRVTLVNFYSTLIPAAREAGHKIVLVALVREADSPEFYVAVQRDWTSLHDATGPDILFVFAGAKAAAVVHEEDYGIDVPASSRTVVVSDHVALAGNVPLEHITQQDYEANGINPSPLLDEREDIASNHTLQIRELANFLGIKTTQLPCLAFTIIRPLQTPSGPVMTVPLSTVGPSNIFGFVRSLAERLEPASAEIDRIQTLIRSAELVRSKQRADPQYLTRLRKLVRTESRELDSSSASDAVSKILALTGAVGRSKADRRLCFQHLQTLREALHYQRGIVGEIHSLIEISFRPEELSLAFDDDDQLEPDHFLDQFHQQESDGWSHLENALVAAIDAPRKQQVEFRQSAIHRLTIVGFVGFSFLVVVIALAIHFGQGSNVVQRVVSDFPLIALAIATTIAIGRFVIGADRLAILGWPFDMFFKK